MDAYIPDEETLRDMITPNRSSGYQPFGVAQLGWNIRRLESGFLLHRFIEVFKRMKCDPVVGFHGTNPGAADSIQEKGLLPPGR